MTTPTFSLLALCLYLVILVPVCIKAKNSQFEKTASSHYLAGRSLGFIVLVLTLYATTFSGNTLLGQTAQSYRAGFIWVTLVGLWMATVMSFHFIVPKLRPLAIKHQFITPGDWLRFRFKNDPAGSLLRLIVALCLCLALINFFYSQLKASGEILEVMTAGALPYNVGIIMFALVILVYDSIGGLRAVAWTDVLQGIIMLAGFGCLFFWLMSHIGGFEQLSQKVAELRPGSEQIPSVALQVKWFSLILLGGLAVTVYPQTLQRIYAAKSCKVLHQSLACMGVVIFLTSTLVVFIGWAAIPMFDLNAGPSADQLMPKILELWAQDSPWFTAAASLVLLAVLAAIMSTADSVLLSLVSMLRHDLTKKSNREDLKYDGRIAVMIMILVCLLAFMRDISLWRLIEIKLELLLQCFPAFVLALHWHSLQARAIIAGLLTGLIVLLMTMVMGISQWYSINIGLVALAANMFVLILVQSLLPHHTAGSYNPENDLA